MQRIQVIDSHTGGEPTRVVIAGGPDLGSRAARRAREGFRDAVRRVPLVRGERAARLGRAGRCAAVRAARSDVRRRRHLLQQRRHPRHVRARHHRPRGHARASWEACSRANTASKRPSAWSRSHCTTSIASRYGTCRATAPRGRVGRRAGRRPRDGRHRVGRELVLPRQGASRGIARRQRRAAHRCELAHPPGGERGVPGTGIDHVELFGPPLDPANHSRNFVLCPGKAYDRSPCGTGTSAKLACLFADGKLKPGEVWRQESIIGSVFEGSYRADR